MNSAFIFEDFVVPHAIYLFQNRGKHETLKVCLVGGVERLENEKLVGGWKSERIENREHEFSESSTRKSGRSSFSSKTVFFLLKIL